MYYIIDILKENTRYWYHHSLMGLYDNSIFYLYNTETNKTVGISKEELLQFIENTKINGVTLLVNELTVYVYTKEMIELVPLLTLIGTDEDYNESECISNKLFGRNCSLVYYPRYYHNHVSSLPFHTIYQLVWASISQELISRFCKSDTPVYIRDEFLYISCTCIYIYKISDRVKFDTLLERIKLDFTKKSIMTGV